MSLRHSNENLPPQGNVCFICREDFNDNDEVLRTVCSHRFHRHCLLNWLKRNSSCPQCRTACSSRDFAASTGVRTRSKQTATSASTDSHNHNLDSVRQPNQSEEGAVGLPINASSNNHANENQPSDESRISTLVNAVISARQASIFDDLETRVTHLIEQQIEGSLTRLLSRANLNEAAPAVHRSNMNNQDPNTSQQNPQISTPNLPPEVPYFENRSGQDYFNRQLDQLRLSSVSPNLNSEKAARLISSWDLKFDGSPNLTVDSFIYRIESQVVDTLNGNFNLLCDNIQCLFSKEAKDWYWRYRRTVDRVTWPSLCQSLRMHFEVQKTDTEIKDNIRARKQGATESFDEYRNSILKIAESLRSPLPETELVEIMQRNLRPRVRQQLLYVPISSLAELRRLCLKGESLLKEISGSQQTLPRRQISEVDEESLNFDSVLPITTVEAIAQRVKNSKITCWNCREEGHIFYDCLGDRQIFCYGCGTPEVYKPKCPNCNPGNSQASEVSKAIPRLDQGK